MVLLYSDPGFPGSDQRVNDLPDSHKDPFLHRSIYRVAPRGDHDRWSLIRAIRALPRRADVARGSSEYIRNAGLVKIARGRTSRETRDVTAK